MGHNSLLLFLPTIAITQGLTAAQAASVYITMYAASAITRFVVPVAADALGGKKSWRAVSACKRSRSSSSSRTMPGRSSSAILFGIGLGGEVPIFPVISRQYYGHAPMSSLYGWQNIGNGVGMALGPALGGLL